MYVHFVAMMVWMLRGGSQQGKKTRGHRRRKMPGHRRTKDKMSHCLSWFFTAAIMGFLCQGVDSASGEFARKLLSDLFQNYTSSIRPVRNTSRPIDVTFGVALAQIIDMTLRLIDYLSPWYKRDRPHRFNAWSTWTCGHL
ncbi:neuronal acetylcholine receptor subunit alpha-9-like [Branchiostoma floridae]|uniref:Neuronal acetylcholine receptor subunit alpha-9-like n=1 Tax=Branchiostoma floridae TaxID=7739 RepID=A0A9J7LHV3_BRAFL|nr:neuronal acetylcholine receptor subunit alpha-9-like [Branchiostoma floridae]